ncbi:MAG: ATP-binding cassette domain-containing protein, partial [Hyphomicrobiaceae bacterium]
MSQAKTYLLELEGLTKSFPGVLANDDVSFRIEHGEIHALLGENGAGKSTLVKMIYGVLRPDGGEMHLHGEHYKPSNPAEARAHGIGMVFQHFSLFEALTVTENIELGIAPELAKGDLRNRIADVSEYYGLKLDPDRLIGDLSVGQRQRVEIVRCLLQNPRLIIMDEPTSVLTPQEVETLFATLRKLAEEGCSILYISHKLEEIRALCQKATILRGGKVVATCTPAEETAKSL